MKSSIAMLCLTLALLGCTSNEPSQADRDACAQAGHSPGTEAFDVCLQERLAARFSRPAGSEVDELRTRLGPRI